MKWIKKNLLTKYILSLKEWDIFYSDKPSKYFTSLATTYWLSIKTEVWYFINKNWVTNYITKVIIQWVN